MITGQRVVVVDGLSETEAVLKAVLEPRGLQVTRIRTHDSGQHLRDSQLPNVVVVHDKASNEQSPCSDRWDSVPHVLIGAAGDATHPAREGRATTCFLSKPFQYPELIRAIEQLL